MKSIEALRTGWEAAGPHPRIKGEVRAIGVRLGDGEHEGRTKAQLTVEGGLVGDRWARGDDPQRHSQITLMNITAAELIQHGDTDVQLAGDNFFVDLDLSEDNLPAGTRIHIGGAQLLVTSEPHNGCKKFMSRFGADALRWVNEPATRTHHLRGIHCEVVAGGHVQVGDAVEVVRD